ncbi:MAG: rRNA maturation RNase YbeY [Muribaculaceae bacterium]|nr:rRNA maturation RNase YbeY [Bacteroides sp.]MDE5846638.1 rRNA maturation RNase YbeY [Muribaculaceae bacterium]MDE6194471.1 rRNA maturation RNase YbeY [Muribaculaceae bacterium]
MIEFAVQGVEMPEMDIRKVSAWIEEVAASHSRRVGNLNYLFVDDEEILVANRQFVNHDYYTDIITFDYSRGDRISGDIMISLDTVASNAEKFGVPYFRELLRVIIHGVLHLVGINDKGPGEREIMEAAENAALELYYNA